MRLLINTLIALCLILTMIPTNATEDIFNVTLDTHDTLLDGYQFTYQYQSGDAIAIVFADGKLDYQWVNGKRAGRPKESYRYTSRQVGHNQYIVAWHEVSKHNYITLFINLNNRSMASSVIVKYKHEKPVLSFQGGIIEHLKCNSC